jgi:hypothetical protein
MNPEVSFAKEQQHFLSIRSNKTFFFKDSASQLLGWESTSIRLDFKVENLFGVAIDRSEGCFVKNLLNWMEPLKKNVKVKNMYRK